LRLFSVGLQISGLITAIWALCHPCRSFGPALTCYRGLLHEVSRNGPRALAERITGIELDADVFSTWAAVGPDLRAVLRCDGGLYLLSGIADAISASGGMKRIDIMSNLLMPVPFHSKAARSRRGPNKLGSGAGDRSRFADMVRTLK
jgi:hypothetical protein